MTENPGRNNALARIAGKLRAQGLEEAEIFRRLLDDPARDGLPESEVRAIARSIASKPAGRRVKAPETGWLSPLHQLAAARGWCVEALQGLGAFDEGNEVHIPMLDSAGIVIGNRRRRADNTKFCNDAKAMTVKGSRNGLIMPWPLPMEDPVLVLEGEADASAAKSAGWNAVIATPGAQPGVRVIEYLQKVLAGRAVVLAPDPDGAGEQWRDKIASALHAVQCEVKYIPPLPDQDLDKRLSRLPEAEREAWLKKQIEEAMEWKPPPASWKGAARHIIRLGPDEGRVNDQVLAALASDTEVFSRGGQLVQVVQPYVKGVPRIVPIAEGHLRDRISRHCAFEKLDTRTEEYVSAHPPLWCVRAIHQRGAWPSIRPLSGVIESPTLRPDGSILDQPSYDTATGLLYIPNDTYPSIPANPNREQAQASATRLLDLIVDFPFANDVARSVWLAFLLTLVARDAIEGCVPLFAFDANVRGTGKTLEVNVAVVIATGRTVSGTTHPRDEDEFRKRISSFALEGRRIALIDNISGDLGADALDSALTLMSWDDRKLGSLASLGEIPLRLVWAATGNNLSLRGDMVRRVLFARIDCHDEKPEERTGFKYPKLLAHTRRNRPQLLVDALTIIRAYFAAQRPTVATAPLGSFEEWTDLIAAAIVWIGLPDPVSSRVVIQEKGDRECDFQVGIVAALERWERAVTGASSAQMVMRAERDPALRSLLEGVFGNRLDASRLGRRLGKVKGRVVAGKKLVTRVISGDTIWSVESSNSANSSSPSLVEMVE